MPTACVPPLFIAGGVVPPYYPLLIGVALAAALILGPAPRAIASGRSASPRIIPAWFRRSASTPA